MSNEEIIQELDGLEVYLYLTKNVKDKAFVVEKGSLQLVGIRYLNMSKYHDTYMVFRPAEESGLKYIVKVSATEGKVHNGKFWLRERDDDRAIDILIANAEERIEQYNWIDKNRYYELKYFCLQYPLWKRVCDDLDALKTTGFDLVRTSEGELRDPVALCAAEREIYLNRICQVEKAARDADPYLSSYILKAVTEGHAYSYLYSRLEIPCSRDTYYDRYRKFFWLLDQMRE